MIEFVTENQVVDYQSSLSFMKIRTDEIISGKSPELIWFLEHDNIITKGLNADDNDILDVKIPIVRTNRGGKFTYHGKGQRIVYCLLDLKKRSLSVDDYVSKLEDWVINTLKEFNIKANRSDLGRGVFVGNKKIASIGLRIKKLVSYHGISLNVSPDLSFFKTIVPCGIHNAEVTSIKELLGEIDMQIVDLALKKCFNLDC